MENIQKEQSFGSKKKRLYLIGKEEFETSLETLQEENITPWDIKPVSMKKVNKQESNIVLNTWLEETIRFLKRHKIMQLGS